MNHSLMDCRAARVPKAGIAALASLRRRGDLRIAECADSFWVQWENETLSIAESLLPVAGVVFYRLRNERWQPLGKYLPDFASPIDAKSLPLDRVIQPAPFEPLQPPRIMGRRVKLSLVDSRTFRQASAMRCELNDLIAWCESATTDAIERLQGAVCDRHVWLRGEKLPWLPRSERFWGDRVLTPLGKRPEPCWPEAPLRQAALAEDDELLILTNEGCEIIPLSVFRPLSRAAVRMAG